MLGTWIVVLSIQATYRLFQVAVGGRDGGEQAFVEIEQPVADLVFHLGLAQPYLVGLPEDLDMHQQLGVDFLALGLAQAQVVELLGGHEDAAQGVHDGTALGFGGVGGEHRDIAAMVEQLLQLRPADAAFGEVAQGVVEGAYPEGAAGTRLAPAQAMLVGLLGDVHQAEIDAEGAYHVGKVVGIETVDHPGQALAQGGVLGLAQADVALAQGLDGIEDLDAGLLAQHLAEQVAEQPHA
jgi:hypothetical protein